MINSLENDEIIEENTNNIYYYNQIIEYFDGTRDMFFENAKKWAQENNARFVEIESLLAGIRRFQIIELTLAEKQEEVRQIRAELYAKEKDPITCQIQSLRDEEQTDEIITEIESLIAKRTEIVAKIKEENPYPEEKEEIVEENVEENVTKGTIL
jgi:hypothetical protein